MVHVGRPDGPTWIPYLPRKAENYMPELVPVYEQLCILAGDGGLVIPLFQPLQSSPFYERVYTACWTQPPVGIIRNYDYDPRFFEGVLLNTNWLKPIIGISDCNWGLLDGMNIDGLTVSLHIWRAKN